MDRRPWAHPAVEVVVGSGWRQAGSPDPAHDDAKSVSPREGSRPTARPNAASRMTRAGSPSPSGSSTISVGDPRSSPGHTDSARHGTQRLLSKGLARRRGSLTPAPGPRRSMAWAAPLEPTENVAQPTASDLVVTPDAPLGPVASCSRNESHFEHFPRRLAKCIAALSISVG